MNTPTDGIKAILAGAHAVQMVSAILRNGPSYLIAMRNGLALAPFDAVESAGSTAVALFLAFWPPGPKDTGSAFSGTARR